MILRVLSGFLLLAQVLLTLRLVLEDLPLRVTNLPYRFPPQRQLPLKADQLGTDLAPFERTDNRAPLQKIEIGNGKRPRQKAFV